MSLKQKQKKIKLFIKLVSYLQILFIVVLYFYIYSVHNRGDGLVYKIGYFDVDFGVQVNAVTEKPDDRGYDKFAIVASINGIRYYYPHCSGVGRIKPENLVHFTSEEAAERAGYTLANNCKK